MEEMITLSERSKQSYQTELSLMIDKYGERYPEFLAKYPTLRKRTDKITSMYDSVKRGGMSLVQLDKYFSSGASEYWIRIMLVELFMFLGAMETIKVSQVKMLAQRIRQEYYHLTAAELTYFFYAFSIGDYGKLYVGRTVNPQDVLIGLKEYSAELLNVRARHEEKVAEAKREAQIEQDKKESISYEEWKKMKGEEIGENPIDRLMRKLCNNNK